MNGNGIMHVVDSFLRLPGNVTATAREMKLHEFVGTVERARTVDLMDAVWNATIFVPRIMRTQRLKAVQVADILAYISTLLPPNW